MDASHHFILEMQNIYTPPFEERITFYACKMVAGQGKAGWEYNLDPVFAVAVTDFDFSHMSPKLVHDVMLVDRENMEPLTDKVHILLCSLKQLPEKWEDCTTEIEEVLFLIKNMDMDSTSLAYREGRFTEIFEAARSSRLRDDQIVDYSKSLERLRDTQKGMEFIAAKERAAGREEGKAEEKVEIARNLLASGISLDVISSSTGLTISDIKQIDSI